MSKLINNDWHPLEYKVFTPEGELPLAKIGPQGYSFITVDAMATPEAIEAHAQNITMAYNEHNTLVLGLREALKQDELHFIHTALNEVWNLYNQQLERKIVTGDIERKMTEDMRDKAKVLLHKVEKLAYNPEYLSAINLAKEEQPEEK